MRWEIEDLRVLWQQLNRHTPFFDYIGQLPSAVGSVEESLFVRGNTAVANLKIYSCSMAAALCRKAAGKAVSPLLLRPITRSYVDVELWDNTEELPSTGFQAGEKLPTNQDFVKCTFENGKFISPWPQREKGLLALLKWQMTPKKDKIVFPNMRGANSDTAIRPIPIRKSKMFVKDKPHVTWIGHATCSFQLEGVNFITDPVFSNTCSPVDMIGPVRTIQPPIEIEEMDLNICLLSHTHYDHLDISSARRIGNRALWIVPKGVKNLLLDIGITRCIELGWWERHSLIGPSGKGIDIVFTPTKHWTSRTLFDKNTALWGSFAVIGASHRFFFSGDTAYCPVFRTIGEHYGPFDMSAISIGAYKPRWFLKDVHCNPDEALQIHLDLRSKQSLAIHWGTFPLSDEDAVEPALELARCRAALGVSVNEFFTMAHGETLFFGEKPAHDFAELQPHMLDTYMKYFKGITSKEVKEIVQNNSVLSSVTASVQ